MKHKFLLGAVAAATMVLSLNAHAVVDLGPLTDLTPISQPSGALPASASFTDVYSFTMPTYGGSLVVGILGSTYSDADSFISSFGATLTAPGGSPQAFDYTNLPAFGYQYLSKGFIINAMPGTYFLTVTGTTGIAPPTYTIDMSVSSVPEPTSTALLLAGLGVFGFVASRRKSI